MNNDPSLLEFGRFGVSEQLIMTTAGARSVIELEYEQHTESSPPVDIHDNEFLDKVEVRRLVTFLNNWLERQ